uniref:transposase family protein n=1 Tax=Rothia dentocariosa TaxID=2047 RepID=UPI003FA366B6
MRLYSGKHHRAGFNYQIICTLDGTLLVITGSATGTHHDAFAYQYHDLNQFIDPNDAIAE